MSSPRRRKEEIREDKEKKNRQSIECNDGRNMTAIIAIKYIASCDESNKSGV